MTAESEILRKYRTIAVVGLSSDETRDSYIISKYMQDAGYRIVPVNPGETVVLGEKAHPTVASVPLPVEIVNVFRRSDAMPAIVDDAIAAGAKVVWMQEGIAHEEAAAKARAAGVQVVMNSCIRSWHRRLAANG
ncbi:MAG TPA: CoA-binding protein [Dehalococcoidia bacterium]